MKKLKDRLFAIAIVIAVIGGFIYANVTGIDHIEDTNGPDDHSLATITAEEISAAAGSFPYEFVCGISRRVPRLYRKDGHTVHSVHYLTDTYHTGPEG